MKDMKRRMALKSLGGLALLGGVASSGIAIANDKENKAVTNLAPKIAIIGGGLAGITMSAHLVDILPKAEIKVFDPNPNMFYEPGFTLIAAGIYKRSEVEYKKQDLISDKVDWIQLEVVSVDPEKQIIKTSGGGEHSYDYLIIATGVSYDWESVKGLSQSLIEDPATNITSIYTIEGALKASKMMEHIAKNGGNVLYAEPRTPIKCGGANKKINFLLEDKSQTNKTRDKLNTTLCVGGKTMLGSPLHAKMIEQFFIARDMKYNFSHNLIEVDKDKNIAVFEKIMEYTLDGESKSAKERVELPYDYLFVIPRMKSASFINEAGLAIKSGDVAGNWVDVDKNTLSHKKYSNIFAIGDCAGVPKGKTGASIRKQYPVIGKNILSHLKGEEMKAKFNGYTACPLLTRYGKAVMVEFGYDGALPSFECLGATRESWVNWAIKVYAMKTMVMKAMIKAKA